MINSNAKITFLLISSVAWLFCAHAIAAEEAAKDETASVAYTVFSETAQVDSSQSVLNPKVKFQKRFKFDLESGILADELISNPQYLLGRFSYYAQDDLDYGLGVRTRSGGLTQESQELQTKNPQLDFSRAPKATTAGFVSLGYNLYYGKLGITNSNSITTTTHLNTDAGLQAYGHVNRPFVQLTVSQLFFMNSNFAFGVNLGLSVAEVTDGTSASLNSSLPAPTDDQFSSKIQTGKFFGLNLNVFL